MTKDEIISGIASYAHEQAVISRIILREGGLLPASRFDEIFSGWSWQTVTGKTAKRHIRMRRMKIRFSPSKDAFILGSMFQGQWAQWLYLMQLMVGAGLLSTGKRDDGEIYYRTVLSGAK